MVSLLKLAEITEVCITVLENLGKLLPWKLFE